VPIALPVQTASAIPTGPVPPKSPPPPAPVVVPLSSDRYKVQVTIGGDTLEKLRLAKDMLCHAIPSGDEAAILDRALTALLADLARKKFAATERPRPPRRQTPASRHVPAPVKRAVWLRDGGRCVFLGSRGRRCHERAFLEFHHVQPYALGGEATAENIQLRCRRHNAYEARLHFENDMGMPGKAAKDLFQNELPRRHTPYHQQALEPQTFGIISSGIPSPGPRISAGRT
jgi:HNH endonuclease